jgi:ABC-type oligopeptide transport system ATPase subunit
VTPRKLNKMKLTRRIPEVLDAMSVQAMVTYRQIVEISNKQRERLSTLLSVMIQRKKRLQVKSKNF